MKMRVFDLIIRRKYKTIWLVCKSFQRIILGFVPYSILPTEALFDIAAFIVPFYCYSFTVTGCTLQMSLQYSAMARSEENLPQRAVLRIDMRVQWSATCQAALIRS